MGLAIVSRASLSDFLGSAFLVSSFWVSFLGSSPCWPVATRHTTAHKKRQEIERRVADIRLTASSRQANQLRSILDRIVWAVNPVNRGHRCGGVEAGEEWVGRGDAKTRRSERGEDRKRENQKRERERRMRRGRRSGEAVRGTFPIAPTPASEGSLLSS